MSGIAAIFNRDGRPVDIRTLTAMLDAVVHRGPDDGGMWAAGPVAIGQRMLHATPEAIEALKVARPSLEINVHIKNL